MRKILAATLVMMMALMGMMAGSAAAELPVLRVGMECAYAPYNWTQAEPSEYAVPLAAGGYADGYDVQVARYLAEQLGMQLEIVKTEWDGLIPALTSGTGKIDAIVAGMSPTAARREVVAFTEPYYESDVVVVVRKDGPFANATSIQELAGARITGQLNTFHYDLIEQIEGVNRQVAMGDFPVMVAALSGGRIDGYISERPGAMSAVAANPALSYLVFEEGKGFQIDPEETIISVAVRQDSPLLQQINTALAGLTEEARLELMAQALERQPGEN